MSAYVAFLPWLALICGGFAGLAYVDEWLARRERRKDIARAHQPRPFDREREASR